jgi:hypothetical protein
MQHHNPEYHILGLCKVINVSKFLIAFFSSIRSTESWYCYYKRESFHRFRYFQISFSFGSYFSIKIPNISLNIREMLSNTCLLSKFPYLLASRRVPVKPCVVLSSYLGSVSMLQLRLQPDRCSNTHWAGYNCRHFAQQQTDQTRHIRGSASHSVT